MSQLRYPRIFRRYDILYYFDTDGNGTDSIADVLETKTKEITHIPVRTYEEFDNYAASIVHKVKPTDLVVLDTINSLANTTRGDAKLGIDPSVNYWSLKDKIIADKNYLTVFELAGQLILRRLKNLSKGGEGARILVTCHEAEKLDDSTIPPTKRRGPDVNPALLGALIGSSSDVFRLRALEDAILDADGKVMVAADTRLLELRRTDEIMAKFHVPLAVAKGLPKGILEPTLPMLYEKLKKKPTWLTIYGSPGTGKSTFATSELR